ncbi:MAG: sigma-54 interaction domain-containing protein [Desulfomonilaceae bacterium]
MTNRDSLLDIMIANGVLSRDEAHLARIQARDCGVSDIEWLLARRRITPRQLFEAAEALLALDDEVRGSGTVHGADESNRLRAAEALSQIVGESEQIAALKRLIERIAPADAAVLIHGESGTGKELVARAIHRLSPRGMGPFVALNCSAIPSELIESELFGHKKGAFTGAVSDHPGVFKAADRGSLFLDEIEAMTQPMQAKLLRALQSGEIRAVGDEHSSFVDVRFICATNADLQQLVDLGRFRKDLLYRISVFEIHTPPLRERTSDIPLLANHFLKAASETGGGREMRIDPAALELLCAYPWPGNVRELLNEIQRAVVMAGDGSTISVRCLSDKITTRARNSSWRERPANKTLKEAVEALERDLVVHALQTCKGKRHAAARLLGLSRQGLLNKINKYKISLP